MSCKHLEVITVGIWFSSDKTEFSVWIRVKEESLYLRKTIAFSYIQTILSQFTNIAFHVLHNI